MKIIKQQHREKIIIEHLSRIPQIDHFCHICSITTNLTAHHIRPQSKGGDNDLDNLIVLCRYCHTQIHKQSPNIHKKKLNLQLQKRKLMKQYTKFYEQLINFSKELNNYD